MPTSISAAELALRLHETDQPALRLDLDTGAVVTDDRPTKGYSLVDDAIVFESLAERNRHVAEFVYAEIRERLAGEPSLLYERGHNLWCREIGHADQASGQLLAMAARDLDILALGSQRIREGADVFDVLYVIEAALPFLERMNLASLVDLCEAKYERTKNDLAGGAIHGAIESWLADRPAQAMDLHARVLCSLTDASASLLSNAVIALARSNYAGAFELARADAGEGSPLRARVGTWTLGRLLLEANAPSDLRAEVAASVSALVETTSGDLRTQAIRAATGAMHSNAAFDALLKQLAIDGDQDVLAGVATTLFLKAGEMLSRGDLEEWLDLMAGLTPDFKGAIDSLDNALSRLLTKPANTQMVVSALTKWTTRHGKRAAIDKTVAELFHDTVGKLSQLEPAWSALVTDWLLSEQQHAACLAGILTSLPHRTPLVPRLDKARMDALDPAGLLFLARRMLGYVHDRAQITSMALSMLESHSAKERIFPVLRALLVDEIGYDYPERTLEACNAAASACAAADAVEFLTDVIESLEKLGKSFDQLPRLNELRPPMSLRRHFALARAKQMHDSVERAQKDSVWRQIATEIPIKAGRGTFSYQSASYGPSMKMSSFSHSIELPRREVFDPVGNGIRLMQYRLATKEEE